MSVMDITLILISAGDNSSIRIASCVDLIFSF
jgi:hypothetical protein